MRSNAHFRLLRLLRLQPRRPARKCAGRGSAPPRSCAADSAQQAYRAIDRLADAWGSWPRRRVFFEGDDTEPSNAPQTPLPQRISGPPSLHCVLTCVLKTQSHRSYPQANLGCRSWQTSRRTPLRNDRPRRIRAPQRCPDRVHIALLRVPFGQGCTRDTNKNTNRRIRVGSISRMPLPVRDAAVPPEAKIFGDLETTNHFLLSALCGKARTISKFVSKTLIFLEITLEIVGRAYSVSHGYFAGRPLSGAIRAKKFPRRTLLGHA